MKRVTAELSSASAASEPPRQKSVKLHRDTGRSNAIQITSNYLMFVCSYSTLFAHNSGVLFADVLDRCERGSSN